MRNALMAGTAGLLIVLGAAGAANAANPNVPTYSPYTLMNVPGSVPEAVRTSNPVYQADQGYGDDRGAGMTEGRAAYVDDGSMRPGYDREGYRNDDSYRRDDRTAYFPFSLLPWNW
jgi:hypothetical protein